MTTVMEETKVVKNSVRNGAVREAKVAMPPERVLPTVAPSIPVENLPRSLPIAETKRGKGWMKRAVVAAASWERWLRERNMAGRTGSGRQCMRRRMMRLSMDM